MPKFPEHSFFVTENHFVKSKNVCSLTVDQGHKVNKTTIMFPNDIALLMVHSCKRSSSSEKN